MTVRVTSVRAEDRSGANEIPFYARANERGVGLRAGAKEGRFRATRCPLGLDSGGGPSPVRSAGVKNGSAVKRDERIGSGRHLVGPRGGDSRRLRILQIPRVIPPASLISHRRGLTDFRVSV